MVPKIMEKKQYIINRLNADFQKVYFGRTLVLVSLLSPFSFGQVALKAQNESNKNKERQGGGPPGDDLLRGGPQDGLPHVHPAIAGWKPRSLDRQGLLRSRA